MKPKNIRKNIRKMLNEKISIDFIRVFEETFKLNLRARVVFAWRILMGRW